MGRVSRTVRALGAFGIIAVFIVGLFQGAIRPVGAVELQSDRPAAQAYDVPLAASAAANEVMGVGHGGYIAVTPARLASIRAMAPGAVDLEVAGRAGVPESGAGVVVLNLSVRNAGGSTSITAWPAGAVRPTVPNLVVDPSRAWTTLALVGLGTAGKVSVHNQAGRVDMDVDVLGWFPVGAEVIPLSPARILDTKTDPARKIGPGETLPVQLTGRGGIPSTGVAAAVLAISSSSSSAWSRITVAPSAESAGQATDLVTDPSRTRTNLVIVVPGTGGAVSVRNEAGRTHLALDVLGWIPSGSAYRPVPAVTLRDTRSDGVPLASGGTMDVQVAGDHGIPDMQATGIARPYAVVLELFAPAAADATALEVDMAGADRPASISLAGGGRQPTVTLAIARLSEDGKVSVRNVGSATHVVVGVRGWFAGPILAAELVVPPRTLTPEPAKVVEATLSHDEGGLSGGTFEFVPGAYTVVPAGSPENAEETDTIAVGDHVVFGATEATPEGYLGTIDEITELGDGRLEVETSRAYLDEVFPEGDITVNLEPSDDSPAPAALSRSAALGAVLPAAVGPQYPINPADWGFDPKEVEGTPPACRPAGDSSLVTHLGPYFGYTIGIKWSIFHPTTPPRITALATLGVGAGVMIKNAAVICEFSKELWGPKIKTFMVGPWPVVVAFELEGSVEVKAGMTNLDLGLMADAHFTVGIRNNTPVAEPVGPTFHVSPDITGSWVPENLRGYAMADLWLDFAVRFYGVFGPKFGVGLFVEAFATTDTRQPWWGVDAGAAVRIVPSFKILKWQKDLPGWVSEIPIAEWAGIPTCTNYGPGPGFDGSGWKLCKAVLTDPVTGERVRADGSTRTGLINGDVEYRFRLLSAGQPVPLHSSSPVAGISLTAGRSYAATRDATRLLETDGAFTSLATGGDRIRWQVVSGLPGGMSLTSVGDGDAVLSGTPTTVGNFTLLAQPRWVTESGAFAGPYPADYARVSVPIRVSSPVAPTCLSGNPSTSEDTALVVTPQCTSQFGDPMTYRVTAGPSHGTVTPNPLGAPFTFTYTPASDFHGPDSFSFKANDGVLDSNEATYEITVNGVNDAPTCRPAYGVTAREDALAVTLACTDVDGDALAYQVVDPPTLGTLTWSANGTYTYTYPPDPEAVVAAVDSFTFKANDGHLDSNVATYTITINPPIAPLCTDMTGVTEEDTPLTGSVTCLNRRADSPGLTYSIMTGPTRGTLDLHPDGSFTYSPDLNVNGDSVDSFTFRAFDGAYFDIATYTITINPVDDAPVCADAAGATDPLGGPLGGTLVCTDIDGPPLSYAKVADPLNGTVTVGPTGTFTYTPDVDYFGPDSFTFKANDGTLDSNTATYSITVTPPPNYIVNGGFETGDLSGWTVSSQAGRAETSAWFTIDSYWGSSPSSGQRFGVIGGAAGATSISQTFYASPGDTLSGKAWAWAHTFDGTASVTILNAVGQVVATPFSGYHTSWTPWSYQFTTAGRFTVLASAAGSSTYLGLDQVLRSLSNGGFETGTMSGWTVSKPAGRAETSGWFVVDTIGYRPSAGSWFGVIGATAGGTSTSISEAFYANPGDTLSGKAWAWAHLFNGTASVRIVNTLGQTIATPFSGYQLNWTPWSYTFLTGGHFTVVAETTGTSTYLGLDEVAMH